MGGWVNEWVNESMGDYMTKILRLGILLMLAAVSPLVAQQSSPAGVNSKGALELERGEAALRARAYEIALTAFKNASAAFNKSSPQAFYGMARSYHGLGAF